MKMEWNGQVLTSRDFLHTSFTMRQSRGGERSMTTSQTGTSYSNRNTILRRLAISKSCMHIASVQDNEFGQLGFRPFRALRKRGVAIAMHNDMNCTTSKCVDET